MITPFLVPIDELINNSDRTSLKSSAASGESTLSVYSINKFAINLTIVIGDIGSEGSEKIDTHVTTAPSGTTITLNSALVKNHVKDTPVYIVPYDQVEFYYAATETGAKTLQETQTIDVEREDNRYDETTYSTGYLFSRFSNSITGAATDYSDPYPIAGADQDTVGSIINGAMSSLGKEYSEILTYDKLMKEVNASLRYIRGKLKKWSNLEEFDYVVDQIDRGEYRWALPDTYYDPNSNRSCLSVRIGDGVSLRYIDKKEYEEITEGYINTTVATQGEIGDTSLVLTSTNDLPDSGTIHVYSSNTRYTLTYTDNDKDTETLSGIPASGDGSITATLAVALDVWHGENEGEPYCFTIFDGYIYILDLVNSAHAGENIYMDFYTEVVRVDSDADIITLARYDLVTHWVRWMIVNFSENNGKLDMENGDWLLFQNILADAVRRETTGQKGKWNRKINSIDYSGVSHKGDPTLYDD